MKLKQLFLLTILACHLMSISQGWLFTEDEDEDEQGEPDDTGLYSGPQFHPGCDNPTECFCDPCNCPRNPCRGQCFSDYCDGCHARCICDPAKGPRGGTCGRNQWCRASSLRKPYSDEYYYFCTEYQGQGESCGGFVRPDFELKCSPKLVCTDFSHTVADLPGICRAKCGLKCDNSSQYCSHSNDALPYGVCRDMGSCFLDADCDDPSNEYPAVACVGTVHCEDGSCVKKCGNFA